MTHLDTPLLGSPPLGALSRAAISVLLLATVLVACPWGELLAVVHGLDVRDTDDAMRLVEVRDLLHGQAWYDLVQARYLPPGGVLMHWSRLIDAPLAAGVAVLSPWLGEALAFGIVAATWPVVLAVVLVTLLFLGARAVFSTRCACLASVLTMGTSMLRSDFAFGRVDHHNVQAIATLAILFCVMLSRSRPGFALAAGIVGAFSLAVGLETLAYVGMAGAFYVGDWILAGRSAARLPVSFALALLGAGLACFLAQTGPEQWAVARCDALSPPWLAVSAAGALLVPAMIAVDPPRAWQRAALAACVATLCAVLFALAAPSCLDGPWAEVPTALRAEWFAAIPEMRTVFAIFRLSPIFGCMVYGPLVVAVVASLASALFGPTALRRHFAVLASFASIGLAISLLQVRGAYIADVVPPLLGGYLLDRALGALAQGRRRTALASLAFGLATIGPAWGVVAASAVSDRPGPDEARAREVACSASTTLRPLDRLAPGTILAPIAIGPFLLLHTRHAILSASYHRAPAGLEVEYRAFESPASLRRYVDEHHADYVALCAPLPAGAPASFREGLASGEATPPWLERIPLGAGPLLVWRVLR